MTEYSLTHRSLTGTLRVSPCRLLIISLITTQRTRAHAFVGT
jgi:hypothetical protein